MNKFKIFSLILSFQIFPFNNSYAQLDKVCPVSSTVLKKDKLKDVNLLLNTKDFKPVLIPEAKTTQTATVQLVNAVTPFPPLYYQIGNPVADTGGFISTTFLLDARIQKETGNFTYLGSYPFQLYGSIAFDTATLLPLDTVVKYHYNNANIMIQHIDLHDFQVDANGNKLLSNQVKKIIDVACLSGNTPSDKRLAVINEIIILDKKDSIIFKWDPLEHLSPCEMNWEYRNSSLKYDGMINWSHINAARFANDGNILYSLRHIGLGKINRKTGEIMWKLGGKDSSAIPLDEKDQYYLQHDFYQAKDGKYYVFSNGDSAHQFLEGIVYDIDEKNKKAVVVNRYRPKPDIFSKALGSYECDKGICLINFGMYIPSKKDSILQPMAHILVNDELAAIISAPKMNFSYQIHQTKWSALQRRPSVTVKKNKLYSDTKTGLSNYTWYKIDGQKAEKAGTGTTFTPLVSGKYVVEAEQGSGFLKSYLVSDVITFKKKK